MWAFIGNIAGVSPCQYRRLSVPTASPRHGAGDEQNERRFALDGGWERIGSPHHVQARVWLAVQFRLHLGPSLPRFASYFKNRS